MSIYATHNITKLNLLFDFYSMQQQIALFICDDRDGCDETRKKKTNAFKWLCYKYMKTLFCYIATSKENKNNI